MGQACNEDKGGLGTYACSNCGYELFRRKNEIKWRSSLDAAGVSLMISDILVARTVHKNSFVRTTLRSNSSTIFQVACGRCEKILGHEYINGNEGGKNRFGLHQVALKYIPKRQCGIPLSFIF